MESSLFALAQQELMQWLFDERLKSSASIQRGSKGVWQKLDDTPEWNLFYGACNEDKDWVLLRKSDKKKPFKQKGPYSTRQICRFLEMGLCSAQDFIWRAGFKEWKRISLISDFFTHPADTIEDILTQQGRKYTAKKARILRYSPSGSFLDWSEFQNTIQDFYI